MIPVSFSLFPYFSLFFFVVVVILLLFIFRKILLLLLLLLLLLFYFVYLFFLENYFIFSCSGMFRNVPACSGMFHVPGFIDGLRELLQEEDVENIRPTLESHKINLEKQAVDKTRNMEHSGTCRNIPEHSGT